MPSNKQFISDDVIIMQFFSKYKNLFEIPTVRRWIIQGLSIPQSRLKLDNDLFVQKVYQGTTKQEYSLNNKLRQLKRDYSQFQTEMNQLTNMRKTTKRSVSRKGKEGQQKVFGVSQKNNQNRQFEESKFQAKQMERKIEYQRQKQKLSEDMLKRESWLQDEHKNILKHSQIDHIFNNKLNKIYDLDEIKISTLPKIQPADHFSMDNQSKRNNFLIKQRSKKNTQAKSPFNERKGNSTAESARQRRQKAKDTLQFRRKKLEQLLKSLW